jgi:hypothetical protein
VITASLKVVFLHLRIIHSIDVNIIFIITQLDCEIIGKSILVTHLPGSSLLYTFWGQKHKF